VIAHVGRVKWASAIPVGVSSRLRRAVGFAVVGSLALAAPALGRFTAVPFAVVGVLALVVSGGPLFEVFARPADRQDERLRGLAGFAFAATGLALLTALPRARMPVSAFVAAVLVLAYGNLGRDLVNHYADADVLAAAGFSVAAAVAALAGQFAVVVATGGSLALPSITFFAVAGALLAALLREVLYTRDDPLVVLSVGLFLWLFAVVGVETTLPGLAVALAVTLALGYVSFALGTASVAGMLTGVLSSLLTLVLGGVGWFAVLLSFFGVGSLSTKYKYEEKRERGIAQDNEGARGSGNVLGNSGVALLALLLFAGHEHLPVGPLVLEVAFAGAFAAAMSDTLSSELGGLYDGPRLITTFERVEPGTDGAVTVQGELFGLLGALLVAAVAFALMDLSPLAAGAVVLGGLLGMTADSLLGATLEGGRLNNQTVNFLATLVGALGSVVPVLLL
jgi:uncharacterized protein (TIGR00297 family)